MTKVGGEIAVGLLLYAACGALIAHATPSNQPPAATTSPLAQAPAPSSPASAATTPDASTGKATNYGKKFQGRKTASGEPFDMNKLTAANNHHPFGTMLKVTNVANGESVVQKKNR